MPAYFDHDAYGATDCNSCHKNDAPADHYDLQCSECHTTNAWLPRLTDFAESFPWLRGLTVHLGFIMAVVAVLAVVLTLDNTPGSLYNALGVFAGNGINLTKIESRPSKKSPWEYLFFIDFQGNLSEDRVRAAMEEIRAYTRDIIVLGSYPEGRTLA